MLAANPSVADFENNISIKQTEFDNYNSSLKAIVVNAASLEQELGELRENAILADADRQSALIEMNLQYEKIIDDPELDIPPVLETYAKLLEHTKQSKMPSPINTTCGKSCYKMSNKCKYLNIACLILLKV